MDLLMHETIFPLAVNLPSLYKGGKCSAFVFGRTDVFTWDIYYDKQYLYNLRNHSEKGINFDSLSKHVWMCFAILLLVPSL